MNEIEKIAALEVRVMTLQAQIANLENTIRQQMAMLQDQIRAQNPR